MAGVKCTECALLPLEGNDKPLVVNVNCRKLAPLMKSGPLALGLKSGGNKNLYSYQSQEIRKYVQTIEQLL